MYAREREHSFPSRVFEKEESRLVQQKKRGMNQTHAESIYIGGYIGGRETRVHNALPYGASLFLFLTVSGTP